MDTPTNPEDIEFELGLITKTVRDHKALERVLREALARKRIVPRPARYPYRD